MNELKTKQQEEIEAWHRWNSRGQTLNDPDFVLLINRLMPAMKYASRNYRTAEVPDPAIDAELVKILTDRLKKYDPNAGTQLNTWALAGIKQVGRYVRRYMNPHRIPDDRAQRVGLFKHTVNNMIDRLGRTPADSEIADELKWPTTQVELIQKEIRKDINMTGYLEEIGVGNNLNILDQIHFLRFELQPEEQVVLDHIYGFAGKRKIGGDPEELSMATGIPKKKVYRITDKIAKKVKQRGIV